MQKLLFSIYLKPRSVCTWTGRAARSGEMTQVLSKLCFTGGQELKWEIVGMTPSLEPQFPYLMSIFKSG